MHKIFLHFTIVNLKTFYIRYILYKHLLSSHFKTFLNYIVKSKKIYCLYKVYIFKGILFLL